MCLSKRAILFRVKLIFVFVGLLNVSSMASLNWFAHVPERSFNIRVAFLISRFFQLSSKKIRKRVELKPESYDLILALNSNPPFFYFLFLLETVPSNLGLCSIFSSIINRQF